MRLSAQHGITMSLTEHGVEADWTEKGFKRSVLVPDDNIAMVEFEPEAVESKAAPKK